MAWVDDRFWCHPKFSDLSDRATAVWVKAIAYSSGMHTRGALTAGQQRLIGATDRAREELVAAGLWDDAGGGSVVIHDWNDHNEKRDERRERERLRKKEARALWPSSAQDGRTPGRRTGATRARVEGSEGSDGSEGSTKTLAATPRERPRTERARDEIWDALVLSFGEPGTDAERKARNGAAKELRGAGATPAEIDAAVRQWPKQFPNATVTPHALVRHWGALKQQARSPVQRLSEAARIREKGVT